MRYDIRAKVRTYKDKMGEDKAVYATIGSAWIGDKTNSITLDMIPVNWDGKAFLNEPYEKDSTPLKQHEVLNHADVLPDNDTAGDKPDLSEIPFS